MFSYLLIFYFLVDFLQYISPVLRYVKYLCPFFFALAYYSKSSNIKNNYDLIKIQSYFRSVLVFYLVIYAINFILTLLFNTVTFRFFANVFFVLAPLLSLYYLIIFFNINNRFFYFKIIFWGNVVGFLIEQGSALGSISNFSILNLLVDSSSETESNLYPFIFSFLFLFCLTEKYSYKYKILSIFLLVLGSKRIVLVSLALVYILNFIIQKIRPSLPLKNIKLISSLFVISSLFLVFIYFQFAKGVFDDIIEKNFNQSANQLTQGRQFLYNSVMNDFDIIDHFFGKGIGASDILVDNVTNGSDSHLKNLHSEILRNYMELGIILFVIWVYCKVKFIIKNQFSFLAILILFLFLISDNVLIYFECIFMMYLLMLLSFFNNKIVSPRK